MANPKRLYLLISIAMVLAWLGARQPDTDVVHAVDTHARPASPTETHRTSPATPLPQKLQRPMLIAAERDPFALLAPPAPAAPPPPPHVEIAPAPPQAPPTNLGFSGRMTGPDGKETVYLTYGDQNLAVAVGKTLPNGYRVESVSELAVELSYPSLNITTRFELPARPKYETR